METLHQILILVIFPGAMVYAAGSDLFSMTISNWISVVLITGFAVLAAMTGMPVADIGQHLAAGLVVLVVGFALFSFGVVGGGDAKLFACAALWIGWEQLVEFTVVVAIAGGILTIFTMIYRTWPLHPVFIRQDWLVRLHGKDAGVPYGIAIAVGGLILYQNSIWMTLAV